MDIKRLIIGAPFGNYLHFEHTTPTIGTYTWKYRGGFWWRLWKVLSTVRYYPGIQAWKNSLGLPNSGIHSLKATFLQDKIISVKGFDTEGWILLLEHVWRFSPAAIELNISCPNCPGEDKTNYSEMFWYIKKHFTLIPNKLIVKLPPVEWQDLYTDAFNAGIRNFHCCNTLPTPGGGLSGKPLQSLSIEVIKRICCEIKTPQVLIGGGGITSLDDIKRFQDAGATHFSIASGLFFPWRWKRVKEIARRLEDYYKDKV